MAEVLITLGIIGIVAALTIPALISKHEKKVTETKLANFYSKLNNALRLSEIENGEAKYWDPIPSSGEQKLEWLNKYLFPYLKYAKTRIDRTDIYISMLDGTLLYIGPYTADWYFFTKASDAPKVPVVLMGRKRFLFNFAPYDSGFAQAYGKLMIPYTAGWNGTETNLKAKCTLENGAFCTKLIERNGWKIPDDYPIKF